MENCAYLRKILATPLSNTPYLGTDVTFMYVTLPLRGVVSADVSVSEIEGPF